MPIALTDDNNYHNKLQSPLEVVNGMDVISGIELRVESQNLDQQEAVTLINHRI